MVKNNVGGNKVKTKARKNNQKKEHLLDELKKTDDQEYAYIKKKLGNGRYDVFCTDRVNRIGISCGIVRKRFRIELGNIILISLRGYQDKICDILHVYNQDEVDKLTYKNEFSLEFIKESKNINGVNTNKNTSDNGFEFTSTFDEDVLEQPKHRQTDNIDDMNYRYYDNIIYEHEDIEYDEYGNTKGNTNIDNKTVKRKSDTNESSSDIDSDNDSDTDSEENNSDDDNILKKNTKNKVIEYGNHKRGLDKAKTMLIRNRRGQQKQSHIEEMDDVDIDKI